MDSTVSIVAEATQSERLVFYKKTYLHIALALLSFFVLEIFLLNIIPIRIIMSMSSSALAWAFVLGVFFLFSFLTDKLAFAKERSTQYLGLGLYIVIEAIVFLPIISIGISVGGVELIGQAAIITLCLVTGISVAAFTSNQDFSFLRTIIVVASFISLGMIIVGLIFGFELGLWFSVGMVLLAGISILYETSQLKNDYQTDQYVGAALRLFASIMLLLWYVIKTLISLVTDD